MIKKNFTKILFPIDYREKNEVELNRLFEKYIFETTHINDEVKDKINSNSGLEVGQSFVLRQNLRKELGLPSANSIIKFVHRGDNSDHFVKLSNICLHIFETKIAFLEYEFEYMTDSIDECIDYSYFLCETKSEKNMMFNKVGKDVFDGSSPVTLSKINSLIFKVFAGFDEKHGFEIYKDQKPLIFSSYLFDKYEESLNGKMNNSLANFKASYLINKQTTFSPFENSVYGASLNGCVNFTYLTDNEGSNKFFNEQLETITKNNYFFLYLLCLNQRFTLQKRLKQISKLIIDEKNVDESILKLSKLISKCRLYETRCSLDFVSSMEHINGYFKYIKEKNSISVLEKELTEKVKSCKDILERYKTVKKRQNEIKQTKMAIVIFIITSFIGSLTTFRTTFDIVEKIGSVSIKDNPILILIPIVLTMVFLVGIIIQIVLKIKDLKRLKKTQEYLNLM